MEGRKILVVVKDEKTAEEIEQLLQKGGYPPKTRQVCDDGEKALSLIGQEPPIFYLVIIVSDNLELIREIKRRSSSLPIIMITNNPYGNSEGNPADDTVLKGLLRPWLIRAVEALNFSIHPGPP